MSFPQLVLSFTAKTSTFYGLASYKRQRVKKNIRTCYLPQMESITTEIRDVDRVATVPWMPMQTVCTVAVANQTPLLHQVNSSEINQHWNTLCSHCAAFITQLCVVKFIVTIRAYISKTSNVTLYQHDCCMMDLSCNFKRQAAVA